VRRSTLLIVALVIAAGAGCDASDEERVQSAYKAWLVANLRNDHERVCALMTPEYRRQQFDDCLNQVRRRAEPATPRQKRNVEEVQVANVRIDRDTAVAYLRLRGCTSWGSEFRRMANGEWRYDGPLPTIGREPRCRE
jgi:hypothetical protein